MRAALDWPTYFQLCDLLRARKAQVYWKKDCVMVMLLEKRSQTKYYSIVKATYEQCLLTLCEKEGIE